MFYRKEKLLDSYIIRRIVKDTFLNMHLSSQEITLLPNIHFAVFANWIHNLPELTDIIPVHRSYSVPRMCVRVWVRVNKVPIHGLVISLCVCYVYMCVCVFVCVLLCVQGCVCVCVWGYVQGCVCVWGCVQGCVCVLDCVSWYHMVACLHGVAPLISAPSSTDILCIHDIVWLLRSPWSVLYTVIGGSDPISTCVNGWNKYSWTRICVVRDTQGNL